MNSFTNPTQNAKATGGDSQFHPKQKAPNTSEQRTMLALAIAEGVWVTMDNHYYTFGGVIRKQLDGGSIGTEIAG